MLSTVAGVSEAYEDAANCLWLLTNSKPCANCKSPIQKNEGCNHMQCAKVYALISVSCMWFICIHDENRSLFHLLYYAYNLKWEQLVCLSVVQVWFLLDLSGGVEEAQLVDRRILSLYSLWGHPTARGAVQGDDCGGKHIHKHTLRTSRKQFITQLFIDINMNTVAYVYEWIFTCKGSFISSQIRHYWATPSCALMYSVYAHTERHG